MNKIVVFIIRLYQKFISHLKAPSCRFYPTCSQYAIAAFEKFTFSKAVFLSIKRILRCHPFHPGGYDPLP